MACLPLGAGDEARVLNGEAEEPEATDDAEGLGDTAATGLGDGKDDERAGDAALLGPGCVVDEGFGPGDGAVSLEDPTAFSESEGVWEVDAVGFLPSRVE